MTKKKELEVVRYENETDDEFKQWERVVDMAECIDRGEGFVYGDLYENEELR